MEQKLEYLSLWDSLTKIYNRTYFEPKIFKARKRKSRNAGVTVGDVDGLKLINDTRDRPYQALTFKKLNPKYAIVPKPNLALIWWKFLSKC